MELKKTQSAMQLAQRYKDFTTLVKLCIGDERRITGYLSKYQQEFANALFQWYYDNGKEILLSGVLHLLLLIPRLQSLTRTS